MASGRTHDRLILWTAPLVGLTTGYVTGGGHWPWLVMGSYVFSGLMFSGDLDIPSRQWRRWGWLRFLWIPYQKICKHRSFWSHGLLVGTLGRLLYVSVILGIPLICGWAWQGWQGNPWPWWQWLGWDWNWGLGIIPWRIGSVLVGKNGAPNAGNLGRLNPIYNDR
ncbi:MAG: metal-binding protein [Gloeomargarita sp. GMQP_bins_14]